MHADYERHPLLVGFKDANFHASNFDLLRLILPLVC